MNVFIDTNVLVDVVAMRDPFFDDSYRVFSRCAKGGEHRVLVSDLSICTMVYLVRKQLNRSQLRTMLDNLQKHLSIVPIGPRAIADAIANFAEDFEDEEDAYTIYTSPDDFSMVREALEKENIPMASANISMIPQNYIALTDEDSVKELMGDPTYEDDSDNYISATYIFDSENVSITFYQDKKASYIYSIYVDVDNLNAIFK